MKIQLFVREKEFFDLIRQKQKPREFNTKTYTKNDLLSLNEKEIEKINFFIKSKIKKIKSLYNFIFGANPAGELYLPKNAPIIMENPQEFFEHNFAIFFENYSILSSSENIKNEYKNIYKDEDLKMDYFSLFKIIKPNSKMSEVLKLIVKLHEPKISIESGKNILTKIKNLLSIKNIEKIVNEKRSKVNAININNINIFNLPTNNKLEKAHIYPVSWIKDDLIKLVMLENKIIDSSDFKKIANKISDPKNLIALEPTLHRKFDSNHFTWRHDNGFIIYEKNEFNKQEDNLYNKIKQLPLKELDQSTINYLKDRNNENRIVFDFN